MGDNSCYDFNFTRKNVIDFTKFDIILNINFTKDISKIEKLCNYKDEVECEEFADLCQKYSMFICKNDIESEILQELGNILEEIYKNKIEDIKNIIYMIEQNSKMLKTDGFSKLINKDVMKLNKVFNIELKKIINKCFNPNLLEVLFAYLELLEDLIIKYKTGSSVLEIYTAYTNNCAVLIAQDSIDLFKKEFDDLKIVYIKQLINILGLNYKFHEYCLNLNYDFKNMYFDDEEDYFQEKRNLIQRFYEDIILLK